MNDDMYFVNLRIDKGWTPPFCVSCGKDTRDITKFACDDCVRKRERQLIEKNNIDKQQ